MDNKFNFFKMVAGKTVHVDVDGTLVKSYVVPAEVPAREKLSYWTNNLDVTEKLYSRLFFCVALRLIGTKLIIWTNRSESHRDVTFKALGIFRHIFSEFEFHAGKKVLSNNMFAIDDSLKGENVLTVERL